MVGRVGLEAKIATTIECIGTDACFIGKIPLVNLLIHIVPRSTFRAKLSTIPGQRLVHKYPMRICRKIVQATSMECLAAV